MVSFHSSAQKMNRIPYNSVITNASRSKALSLMGKLRKEEKIKPRCGLCGKRGKLIKMDCCHNWICDDSHKYVLFSFARNSCYRNHDRYTLCAFHFHEDHDGSWKVCEKCRDSFDTEDYVDLATNEHNFEKLNNPPSFTPTKCAVCKKIISRAKEGYSIRPDGSFVCERCISL